MPEHSSIRDVEAILNTRRQTRYEVQNMPLRCGREATDLVRKASAAYTKAMTGDDTNPFLETTPVEKFSQLRRVGVGLKVTTGDRIVEQLTGMLWLT
jgi:hypothetical protein